MTGTAQHFNILLVVPPTRLSGDWSPILASAGHSVTTVSCVAEAQSRLRLEPFDVAVVDIGIDNGLGERLAQEVLGQASHPEVILMAQRPRIDQAVALAKAGAFDYIGSEPPAGQLREIVEKAGELAVARRTGSRPQGEFDEFMRAFLVSSVPAVQEMASQCRMIASRADMSALVIGETGAGKNLVSRVIHWLSPQSNQPLVALNLLDADPEDLEERLFGSLLSTKEGLLLAASGGSLLLHEISELPAPLQPRLLDLLETGVVRTELDGPGRPFRARLIATSAIEVEPLVDQQQFHAGLFFRLASVTVRVPPLRDRAADIPRIAEAILAQVSADAGRPSLRLSSATVSEFVRYNWPGNLRELRNVLTRLALLCPNDLVSPEDLQRVGGASWSLRPGSGSGTHPAIRPSTSRRPGASSVPVPRISGIVNAILDEPARAERERIEAALLGAEGHRERAAAMLGMSRTTLWTRMRVLGIDHERFRRAKAM